MSAFARRIAVLMTCHNRREMTLACLDSLAKASRSAFANYKTGQTCFIVNLVDDGSTDGTAEALAACKSDCLKDKKSQAGFILNLIRGDGSLYWAKGMELAWRTALASAEMEGLAYDGFLWLNDDVVLAENALTAVLNANAKCPDAVIVGELSDMSGKVVYGKRAELFTGNFVLVPQSAHAKVGMICGDFHHAWADSDYAMRCNRAGVEVVSCGVVGSCEGHPNRPCLEGKSLKWRLKSLFDPKGWCVHDLWLYRLRNWGLSAAVFSSLHLVFHVMFYPWLNRDGRNL